VSALVRAAGGVVVRRARAGRQVLLVHRPEYDDWTFPKGKARPAESDEACAVREVEEETTLRCELSHELPSTRYVDAKGRPKIVRWWLMRPLDDPDRAAPANEVGEVRWLAPEEARELLTYRRDLALLDAL
jgi:8-oxo-dGTP pyrophosphatase MutT (NUDIX family)